MKMKDVFDLPVTMDIEICKLKDVSPACISAVATHKNHIFHTINNHDKLTEENARLREALEASTCAFECFYNLDVNDVDPTHYGEYQAVSGIVSRNKQLLKGDEDE